MLGNMQLNGLMLMIYYRNENDMTRKEAAQLWPIIKAYSEGKNIEFKNCEGVWLDIECPDFSSGIDDYRIKKAPVYRPFGNSNECLEEMVKHHPIGWIKSSRGIFNIFEIGEYYIVIAKSGVNRYDVAINDFTFVDGAPFGIKKED